MYTNPLFAIAQSTCEQLKNFGLNPQDWLAKKVQLKENDIWVDIFHREDAELKLHAKVRMNYSVEQPIYIENLNFCALI